MTRHELTTQIIKLGSDVLGIELEAERIDLARTEPQFGDFATNVAMVYAKDLKLAPRVLAERLVGKIATLPGVLRVEVAGPGFINIMLTDLALAQAASQALARPDVYRGQQIVTEYSDPNPFKVLHAGHLYTTMMGDAISRLFEAGGGIVHRINYGGDVGLHVARAMWGILQYLEGENPAKLQTVPLKDRPAWMSLRYVEGTKAYESNEAAKAEIISLNKRVYELHATGDHESAFANIYWTCREWSYQGFRDFYERLGVVPFERYLPESEVTVIGLDIVEQAKRAGVLVVSDGAWVFKGEEQGLHTRVFMTAAGLPTYEAKELGLAAMKWRDYQFDRSVIITGNDIIEYMKVVIAVLGHFHPEVVSRSIHLTHGMVKMPDGAKMSSRTGNALGANDILDAAAAANLKLTGKDDWSVVAGAVKYAFLRQRMGGNMIYNPNESVSLEGNSGPYLQYAHARARSILIKANGDVGLSEPILDELDPDERLLVRKLGEYTEVLAKGVQELAPHVIATYLYELAQGFNRFYERNRVMGHERQDLRLRLVSIYAEILRDGLGLMGIEAPDHL